MIFDTHAHYDDKAFDEDRDDLLNSMYANGIGWITDVASDLKSIDRVMEVAGKYPFVYAALGIHPSECEPLTEDLMNEIRSKMKDPKVVALGEIGLDYYWPEPDHELQKYWFRKQLLIAQEENLPVIIHSRDAAQDTFETMKEMHAERSGGVIHCFSYSKEMAAEYIKMGFYIGVGGVVTFKNARKLKEVVEQIPIERIVLETDCPYLAPVPHRGERNSSLYLPEVVKVIAALKNMQEEEVVDITMHNAMDLYRISVQE